MRRACTRLAAAGVVGLLLGAGSAASAEERLDRLFFSPLERQALDEARNQPEEPVKSSGGPVREAAAPVVDVISFDGKVERSDGVSTHWVNGRAIYTGNRTAEGIQLESSRGTRGEATFVLPSSNGGSDSGTAPPPFKLKVGEKVAVQNGRKFDAYEDRPAEDAENVLQQSRPPEAAPAPKGAATPAAPAASPGG